MAKQKKSMVEMAEEVGAEKKDKGALGKERAERLQKALDEGGKEAFDKMVTALAVEGNVKESTINQTWQRHRGKAHSSTAGSGDVMKKLKDFCKLTNTSMDDVKAAVMGDIKEKIKAYIDKM